MRAKYVIFACPGTWDSDNVAYVTIDVYGDPTHLDHCIDAVEAAGYDAYEQCPENCGPLYQARFLEYGEPTVEIPFAAIESLAAVINVNQVHAISRNFLMLRDLRNMLLGAGCIEEEGSNVNPVRPE